MTDNVGCEALRNTSSAARRSCTHSVWVLDSVPYLRPHLGADPAADWTRSHQKQSRATPYSPARELFTSNSPADARPQPERGCALQRARRRGEEGGAGRVEKTMMSVCAGFVRGNENEEAKAGPAGCAECVCVCAG